MNGLGIWTKDIGKADSFGFRTRGNSGYLDKIYPVINSQYFGKKPDQINEMAHYVCQVNQKSKLISRKI